MIKARISACTICKFSICRNCRVEIESSVHIPVTIDILGTCSATTGHFVVSNLAADAVKRIRETQVSRNSTLSFGIIGVEKCVHVICKRRLQARITLCDVQGVRVVGNIQKICH